MGKIPRAYCENLRDTGDMASYFEIGGIPTHNWNNSLTCRASWRRVIPWELSMTYGGSCNRLFSLSVPNIARSDTPTNDYCDDDHFRKCKYLPQFVKVLVTNLITTN